MEQSNPTFDKILILDTRKFEQWKFRIQQYLQNEHYALWEVIEFGDSYQVPQEDGASKSSVKKKGRTVAVTIEDMQKRRNDVKVRTTLLLALPDEHQLKFSKYKTAQELLAAILKTFRRNEATKKTKKNQLKQQYGNFKVEGSETLEQTFNRPHAIISHLEFMDIEIEQDDMNQKFLTSLAPKWLMSGKRKVNTASILIARTHVSPASTNVAAASISLDTICAYIASQSNGSQIKFKDINQIDEYDIEEMDIKECRAPRSHDRGKRENYKQGSMVEESAPKALMAIDEVGWDWSYMANEKENHALVADKEAPTEFALMAKSSSSFENKIRGLEFNVESKNNRIERLTNELEELKKEKEGLDSKLTGFQDLDTLLGSQRSDKNMEGLGYSVVPPSWPSLSIESNSNDLQSSNSSISENGEPSSSILSKLMITFVKATDSPTIVDFVKAFHIRVKVQGTPTKPHHTPSPKVEQSLLHDSTSSSQPTETTETILTLTPTEIPTLRQYSRRARIAHSTALPTAANEPASLLGDDSQGEAFPTVSGLEAGQDRENIIKTFALPHDSTPRVTSLAADEGKIYNLKAMIKMLEDKDRGGAEPSGEDATIKGRSLETKEEAAVSVPPVTKIPTGSGLVPTASPIFTTASVVTPYSRHKEEDMHMLIDGLDRNNEVIARHLHEYKQAVAELTIREKIELINELVKYQEHHAKILKYQAQQSKPLSKKQQREFYMSIEDFVPMASKEEGERFKRKRLRLEQDSAKKMKTTEDVFEEDLKEMMQLVPVEEVYVEALQSLMRSFDQEKNNIQAQQKKKMVKTSSSFQIASKDLDNLLESQRLDKNKEGLGYSTVPPPPAQIYSPPKKDMS
nr:hypothetical protein [Tanacetum cinerariifolium]